MMLSFIPQGFSQGENPGMTKDEDKLGLIANYPLVNSVRLQMFRGSAIFEVFINTKDVPKVQVTKDKRSQRVRLTLEKPLITKESRTIPGNNVFLGSVLLKENPMLTQYLELNPPYFQYMP